MTQSGGTVAQSVVRSTETRQLKEKQAASSSKRGSKRRLDLSLFCSVFDGEYDRIDTHSEESYLSIYLSGMAYISYP